MIVIAPNPQATHLVQGPHSHAIHVSITCAPLWYRQSATKLRTAAIWPWRNWRWHDAKCEPRRIAQQPADDWRSDQPATGRSRDHALLEQWFLCRKIHKVRYLRHAGLRCRYQRPTTHALALYRFYWCRMGRRSRILSACIRLPIVRPQLPVERSGKPRSAATGPVDMVMANILDLTMVSICREMGILLMNTLFDHLQ